MPSFFVRTGRQGLAFANPSFSDISNPCWQRSILPTRPVIYGLWLDGKKVEEQIVLVRTADMMESFGGGIKARRIVYRSSKKLMMLPWSWRNYLKANVSPKTAPSINTFHKLFWKREIGTSSTSNQMRKMLH